MRARAVGSRAPPRRRGSDMLGNLYDRALDGERCWIRHDDGDVCIAAGATVGSAGATPTSSSTAPWSSCATVRPSTWVAAQVDWWPSWSAAAYRRWASTSPPPRSNWRDAAARRPFAAMCSNLCPATGRWQTVLLADGNVGLGGDPRRVLRRAAELLRRGGRCIAEFDPWPPRVSAPAGCGWSHPQRSDRGSGGRPSASTARPGSPRKSGWRVTGIHPIGQRVVASLTAV